MKLLEYIKRPRKIINFLAARNFFDSLSDETYLKYRYYAVFGEKLNLSNPQTLNEKIQWLKLNDRDPKYTLLVDKFAVKEIVAKEIGSQYIIPTFGVWNKFEDINFNELPEKFVLKTTHDSSGAIICTDKSKFDMEGAKVKLEKSLNKNYFLWGREWPYRNVKPRIIAEQYVSNTNGESLVDYKLMCFNGKVKCTFLCSQRDTNNGLHITIYDEDWNKLPFEREHVPAERKAIKEPTSYQLMINLAEKLAKSIPFVRIDFYEIDGHPYFGEITFYPASGLEKFEPSEWDKVMGEWLDLKGTMHKDNIMNKVN